MFGSCVYGCRERMISRLLAKQPPHALQHAVLFGVVGVVLGGDLEQRGEGGRVRLDAVSYPLGNLSVLDGRRLDYESQRTCWLMSRMAMSLRSVV